MDGLIDKYLRMLETSTDKDITVCYFYCELLDVELNPSIVKMIKRLSKLYGIQRVMNAIVSVYQMDINNDTIPYGLLTHFLRKQILEESKEVVESVDLTEKASEIEKRLLEKGSRSGGSIE